MTAAVAAVAALFLVFTALEPVLPEEGLSIAGIASFVVGLLVLGLVAGAVGGAIEGAVMRRRIGRPA